jgi:hypothetical protein
MARVATTVWRISPELVAALDDRLGTPVDSYLNGSQTWLVDAPGLPDITLELRLHPVAGYTTPAGLTHYDVWERAVDGLLPLAELWDGLECFAAYGDEIEPPALAREAAELLGLAPDAAGLADHEVIGDAWERAQGKVSIVALLFEQLESGLGDTWRP